MARAEIKGCHALLIGSNKILAGDADETQEK